MSWKSQVLILLFAGMAVSLRAQPASFPIPGAGATAATNLMPPMPSVQSPVSFFRQLLALSPADRSPLLTNRPPEIRARILAKVHEYEALAPEERELRLRATELRWWLTPLMRVSAADRSSRLAQVPADLQALVKSRLQQWDLLPPPLQQEFLANDRTLLYFAHVPTAQTPATTPEARRISEQFNRFFEFTPQEKQQTLSTLSETEHAAMEQTLQAFEKLPPSQRFTCLRNYGKFVGMSAAERAEFLKNAEKWAQMSPKERQTWRDLVAQVPIWPPFPPVRVPPQLMPPLPSAPSKLAPPTVATNRN